MRRTRPFSFFISLAAILLLVGGKTVAAEPPVEDMVRLAGERLLAAVDGVYQALETLETGDRAPAVVFKALDAIEAELKDLRDRVDRGLVSKDLDQPAREALLLARRAIDHLLDLVDTLRDSAAGEKSPETRKTFQSLRDQTQQDLERMKSSPPAGNARRI